MEKKKRKKVVFRHFSESERRIIIEDYLSSGLTKQRIWEKYTGQQTEHGQMLTWMRELGYDNSEPKEIVRFGLPRNKMSSKRKKTSNDDLDKLRGKNEELERKLKDAEGRATAYRCMIDVAEQELKIDIRKKYNTKP